MKKAIIRSFCALVCFVLLFSAALPAVAHGMEIGTSVNVMVEGLTITSKTEDCTLKVGDDLELMATASQTVDTNKWEVSTDGGASWSVLPSTAATCEITDAQLNSPANVPYQYRYTASNSLGQSAEAIIKVLVSDDYSNREIEIRDVDAKIEAYVHNDTRLVVTPLPDSAAAAAVLEAELPDDCLPLVLYDVSLVNQNNDVVPYFGPVKVSFDVGSQYNGMTLRVFHLHGDPAVVTVYSGVVTAGVLTVTVTGLSPFMVEIPAAVDTRTVTVNVGTGGLVSPSGRVNVADGSDKAFTLLPDAGYELDTLKVNDVAVTPTGNTLKLENIKADMTVDVSFRQVTPSEVYHTVTVTHGANGDIYPSGTLQVRHGSAQTVYFYPETGYELDEVLVNGVQVNVIGNSFTLSSVTADTTVHATFKAGTSQYPNVYKKIAPSAGLNGSISPMDNANVEYGGDMYFYFIPNTGYQVDTVTVDGTVTPVSSNSYHFVNVTVNHTINVTFKALTEYTVTASAGAHGSISPSGSTTVTEGGSKTFTFTPDKDYVIDTVKIDGVTTAVTGSTYTFSNVTANHTIAVTYKAKATPTPTPSPSPTPYSNTYYTITASSGENGSISPYGKVTVAKYSARTFYFTADEGYEVDTVTVDGKTVNVTDGHYRFSDIRSAHSIGVTFKKAEKTPEPVVYHSIFADPGENGSISPSGNLQVPDGGSQTFYFIPNEGYEVESIFVNGVKQDVVGGRFTVDNITGDVQLSVTYKPSTVPMSRGVHCFICAWLGYSIAPWCWLAPVLVLACAAGLCWFIRAKRKDEQ